MGLQYLRASLFVVWAPGSETGRRSQACSAPEATGQECKLTAVRWPEDAGSPWRGTGEGPWGRDTRTPGFEDMGGTQDGNSGPPCAPRWARGTGQPLECEMTEHAVVLGKDKFKGFGKKTGTAGVGC